MEVLSRLLHSRIERGLIGYHPRTSEVKVSHLMFADDIMVFFDGSYSSLFEISEVFDDFASGSGPTVNTNKTTLFLAGVSPEDRASMATLGFKPGILPVRYLGLPLVSRKLKLTEYEALLGKLTASFNVWATRSLSLAGRAQLIKSVIMGNLNFWMSTFVLPKGCIKKIERLCARFLWSGHILDRSQSKVAWSKLALPKEEGGIGMKNLQVWNTTLMLRLIWLLFADKQSLWAMWHTRMNLRYNSIWLAKEKKSNSWTWNHILRLRPLATEFIRCRLGNGHKANFWFDTWTPLGQLIALYGDTGPSFLQVPAYTTVAGIITQEQWSIPPPRTSTDHQLHAHLATICLPLEVNCDSYEWVVQGKTHQRFPTKKTWETIRPRGEMQAWSKLVWFKGAIPKHAYHMWLTQLNRLPTRTRLLNWGFINEDVCCICSNEGETREHLFLSCSFAREIWGSNFNRTTPRHAHFQEWEDLLSWTRSSSLEAPGQLRKLVTHATLYHIWKQRNNVLHNGDQLLAATIFKDIERDVKGSIAARRGERRFRNLMLFWLR